MPLPGARNLVSRFPPWCAFGITREMVPALARKAMEDACHLLNPRPCTEADMVALYEKAL